MTQFTVGDTVGRHDLVTIHGKPVHLPDDPEKGLYAEFGVGTMRYTDGRWPVDELLALARGERTSR